MISIMWQNDCEFDVISATYELFLKLPSHISVLWRFCGISMNSEFSFLGVRLSLFFEF